MNYIEIMGLTKYYGKFKALDNINLNIPQGKIIGLLGKNGAGKSTLMRSILGFLQYKGKVNILGKSIEEQKHNIFTDVAFIPDVNSLDDRLTVQQTIDYVSSLNQNWNNQKATELLQKSNLPLAKKVQALSKGMKTKLYLLITLSMDVKILLLDEPTLGLDIVFRKEFFNTILAEFYDETKTIIISTHQVEEVEHILEEIIFIDEGKIKLFENIEKLKSLYSLVTVEQSREMELDEFNPLMKARTLGHISAIIKGKPGIADAKYSIPQLSDLFVAIVEGGKNE